MKVMLYSGSVMAPPQQSSSLSLLSVITQKALTHLHHSKAGHMAMQGRIIKCRQAFRFSPSFEHGRTGKMCCAHRDFYWQLPAAAAAAPLQLPPPHCGKKPQQRNQTRILDLQRPALTYESVSSTNATIEDAHCSAQEK